MPEIWLFLEINQMNKDRLANCTETAHRVAALASSLDLSVGIFDVEWQVSTVGAS